MDQVFTAESLQSRLEKGFRIIRKYDWLVDAYVLDFYVDNHWSKLTNSWRNHFADLRPEYLCFLLDLDHKEVNCVWPLTLLALRQILKELIICRKAQNEDALPQSPLLEHPKLRSLFTKCVKPKKCHEIGKMAAFCKCSADQTPVDFVIDFGAGLGHLARVLGYGYGIKVCCLEVQETLNQQASVIDQRLEAMASKHLTRAERAHFRRPTHVTLRLTNEMQPQEFMSVICKALELPSLDCTFGIIGLHPCGDLGAILTKMFLSCEQAKFLNFVGCCYMKLSTRKDRPNCVSPGYPLSRFLRTFNPDCIHLSYTSREISCHAIEMYCRRLRAGNYEDLKVHSFRAAAERILIKFWPHLKHTGLRNVKHRPDMTFEMYFFRAVHGLAAESLTTADLRTAITTSDLMQWQQIVIFYTLRLMFAPLIESLVLYDRMLFLQENNCVVKINAIFDPYLSPRNHITSAIKKS